MPFFNGFLAFLLFIASGFIILLVLVQRGKGGGLTGALGGMGGQSAFGAKAGDVFTKITVASAAIWIVLCLITIRSFSYREVNKDNIGPFDVKKLFKSDGNSSSTKEPTGLPTIGSSDDEKAGDEKAGDEKAGDEKAGDEKAGDEKAGDEKAGDEKAGDEKAAPPVPPSGEGNGKSGAEEEPEKSGDGN